MKKLLLLLLLLPVALQAQSRTTVTGTIQSPTGTATSGYVEFRLSPSSSSIAFRVTGTSLVVPTTSRCGINSSGNVMDTALTGPCQVWGNTLISPANTTYTVVIAPANVIRSTVPLELISGVTYDLSTPVFTPSVRVVPDGVSIATTPIAANLLPAANNAFTVGSSTLYYASGYFDTLYANNLNATADTISALRYNNIRECDRFPGATASVKIAACIADIPTTGGTADASSMEGAQTWSTCPVTGVTKPITLILAGATHSVGVACTVPRSVSLQMRQGAILSADTGITVTISGDVSGSTSQHFAGAGSIRFAAGTGIKGIPLEWFGAVPDWNGTTGTNNTTAIQTAVNSLPVTPASGETRSTNAGVPVLLVGSGSYMWAGALAFEDVQYVQFVGVNENVSFLVSKPTSSNTDGMKFSSSDGNYRYSNAFKNLSLVSASTNSRRLLWLSQQSDFILDHVKMESYPGAQATNLLYMDGMISSTFYSTEFNTAVDDLVVFATGAFSSTTVNFIACRFEGAGNAGLKVTDAAGINLYASILESLPIGVLVTDDSDIAMTNNWFEANDLAVQVTFTTVGFPTAQVVTTGNQFTGQDQVSSVLFDVDRVFWKSSNDVFNNFFTAWATTSKSILNVLSPARPRSTQYNWFTGTGQFSTSGMPMPVLGLAAKGSVAVDSNLFLWEGGFHTATLTGDTVFHIRNDNGTAYPSGAQITLLLKQDGTGGRAASFGSAGTDYPVVTAFTNLGNVASSYSLLILTFDGTSWIQTAYSPWFSTTAGYIVTSSSATSLALPSGAVATPSIRGTSFSTTGLYWAAGPELDVAVAGNRMASFQAAATKLYNASGAELFAAAAGGSIFNDGGADLDFRVESDTGANAFNLDSGLFGGAGAWGMGTAANANVAYFTLESPTLTVPDNQSFAKMDILTDNAITVTAATTSPIVASLRVRNPTITVSGAVTTAATIYVDGPPSTGTNKSSIHINLGTVNIQSGGSTTISTGVGSVKMSNANAADNAAWIPFQYAGTTYYVPAWTDITP